MLLSISGKGNFFLIASDILSKSVDTYLLQPLLNQKLTSIMKSALLLIPLILLASYIVNSTGPATNDSSGSSASLITKSAISNNSLAKPNVYPTPATPPESPKPVDNPTVESSEIKEEPDSILNDKARQIFNLMKSNPANFTDTYVMRIDLTKFEIVIHDNAIDILNQTYVVNNEESIADVLLGIIEQAHKDRHRQNAPRPNSSQSVSSLTAAEPTWRMTIERRPDGQIIPERPDQQKRSLARQNCGIGNGKFNRFKTKHVINPHDTLPAHYAGLAYLTTLWNRIQHAYAQFSWFFISNVEDISYTYHELEDKCVADQFYPLMTCSRHKQSDHLAVCYYSGLCQPTYFSSTGHYVKPTCKVAIEHPEPPLPDYLVSPQKIRDLQELFVQRILAAPPSQLDWAMSEWRALQWASHSRGQGPLDPVLYPRPTGRATEREILLAQYGEALVNLRIDNIPESVLRQYFYQPRFYVSRLPNGHRQGLIVIGDTMLTANPDFAGIPNTDGILPPPGYSEPAPAMNDENYPELGAPRPRNNPPTEYQANPAQETYDETAERASEIIRAIFSRHLAEQVEPSAEDVTALY